MHQNNSKLNLRLKVFDINSEDPNRLKVYAQEGIVVKTIALEGVWSQNVIPKGSIVHVLDPELDVESNTYIINNSRGFLVIEPDRLLTCTYVASSLFCERKTWLNHVFAGQVGTNRAMLVGTLVHEVFQHGLRKRIADVVKLTEFLDDLLDDATIMLEAYSVEVHLMDIRKEAISYISSVKEWIDKYMFSGPSRPLSNDADLEVKITSIHDIEENVWSTKYGLKGKIDVTGSVRIHNKRNKSVEDKIIPLELKTGNPNLSSSHAAQVGLYSMMIEDRYAETNQGFVIYLKDRALMHNVALTHNIKRDLVQRRNQINLFMGDYFIGPEMIDQPRMCKNCERLTECVLTSKLFTPGQIDHHPGMKSLEADATGHLDDKFMSFFQNYHEKLIGIMAKTKTADDNGDTKIQSGEFFWTYSSEEAEERGSGFAKLQMVTNGDQSHISFKRHPSHVPKAGPVLKKRKIQDYFTAKAPTKPFNTKVDLTRARIAISIDQEDQNMDSQNSSTALAIGFIKELREDLIILKLYEGSTEMLKPERIYRLDKLEKKSQSGVEIERLVLVRLLAADWRSDRVRQLVLNPNFEQDDNLEMNLFVLSKNFDEISELDAGQQEIVVDAISTDNFYIMDERSGLTRARVNRCIGVMARVLANLDRSLLIVAKNIDHLVDVMRILQTARIKFILIDDGKSTKARNQYAGSIVKVLQSKTIELGRRYEAYIKMHETAQVVITSHAMAIGGLQFTRRTFHYCVNYDADSTELLLSLSSMFCSDRYIIVDVREPSDGASDEKTLGNHLRTLRGRQNPHPKTA